MDETLSLSWGKLREVFGGNTDNRFKLGHGFEVLLDLPGKLFSK